MATYIPHEVTDYVNPLKQYAQSAINNNEKALQDALAHSQQLYEADPGRDQLKTFKSLVNFSTTIASALQQKGAKDKAEEEIKQKEHNKLMATLMPDEISEDFAKKIHTHKYKEAEIHKDYNSYIDHLAKQEKYKNVPPQLIDYLKKSSADSILRDQTYLAGIDVANHSATIRKEIAALDDDGKRDFFLKHNTGRKVQDYVTRKAIANLSDDYGFNAEHIASHFITNIKKQAKTFGDGTDINYKIQKLTEDNESFQLNIDQAILSSDENPDALSTLVYTRLKELSPLIGKTGERDWVTGKKQLHMQLAMAVDKGSLSQNELRLIREGLHRGDIPAGKHGDVILTPEQFDDLGKRIDVRDTRIIAQHDAEVDGLINGGIVQARDNQLDPKRHQQLLQRLRTLGVSETSEKYKKLENIDLRSQSQVVYTKEKKRITPLLSTGRVDLKALDLKNNKLSDETETKLAEYQAARELAGMGTDIDSDKWATKETKKIAGATLDSGTPVEPGSQERVRNRISRLRDKLAWDLFQRGELTEANLANAYRAEATLLGRYVKPDNVEDPNYGPLTPTIEGEFPANDVELLGYAEEVLQGGSTPETTGSELTIVNDLWNNKKKLRNIPGKNDKERLMNSGLAVSDGEYVAVYKQLTNENFNLDNFQWPPDLLRKSEILGVEPSVMIAGKTKALKLKRNDKEAESILAAFDLDKLDLSKVDAQVKVRQFLEGKDYRLLSIWQNQGPRAWTNNHMKQLMVLEGNFSNLGAKREFSPEQAKQHTLKFYKDNNAKGAVEDFNTKYPQNNITINDIKWNPVTKKWDLNLQDRDLIPTIRQG